MTKERLKSYQTNKRIYKKLGKEIDDLRERMANLEVGSDQVQKSGDYPYLLSHVKIESADPETLDDIRGRIREREKQREKLRGELRAVESYIEQIDDPGERQIFSWLFLDGMTQEELGDALHYSQGRISQIVNDRMKGEQ